MNPLPKATHPTHLLMDLLAKLQKRMKGTGSEGEGTNVIEAYNHFSKTSDMGRACTYSLKCKGLFLTNDYHDIKELINKINTIIELVDSGASEL